MSSTKTLNVIAFAKHVQAGNLCAAHGQHKRAADHYAAAADEAVIPWVKQAYKTLADRHRDKSYTETAARAVQSLQERGQPRQEAPQTTPWLGRQGQSIHTR